MNARAEIEQSSDKDRLRRAWACPKGLRYFSEVNNSEVGIWYILTALAFMIFAGVLALLMRTQLAIPENDFLSAELYNQAFTLHGTVMMFLFAVPIFEAVAVFLLPAMLGSRELPLPWLSAFGFWCYLIGGVFVCGSIFFNAAPDGGWFMYPPFSSKQGGIGTDIWLLGLGFIEISSISAAVELIVGVLKCRAPGMRINLMPLYGWYVLVVGGMILVAFPPLIAGDLLLELERAFDWPFFDPERGGDPLLWQHLFWIFGHPEVYIIFLPSIAILGMVVPTFAGRPIFGYSWIVLSAIGVGFISFGLWVHHMFTTALPSISLAFFSAASQAVAIPTGIQIFAFIATLMLGSVRRSVPMLFAVGALAIFVAGGLTGVMVAVAPFDFQAHDSYFIVAHLHYTLLGGMLFPLIAGIHYYYPLFSGKMLSRRLGIWSFWLMFTGFNVAFLPMHLTGLRGMPRRIFVYPADIGWDLLNMISSIGAFVFALGFAVFIYDLLRPKSRAPKLKRNPWNAGTVEWISELPPENWGVRCVPHVDSRYPLWGDETFLQKYDAGAFYLSDAQEERRETIITSVLDADPVQCQRVPGPSFVPLVSAITMGGAFITATFHWWWATGACALLSLCSILYWLWQTAPTPEKEDKDIGLGCRVPLYRSGSWAVGWWAMMLTMVADITAFFGLVFGYFFFWTTHSDFPPDFIDGPGWQWPLTASVLLGGSWVATLMARSFNSKGRRFLTRLSLGGGSLFTCLGSLAFLAGPVTYNMDPTAHSYPAIVWVMAYWIAGHSGVGAIMQLYCLARSIFGKMTDRYDADIRNSLLYWHFLLFMALTTALVIGGFPIVA